MPILPLRAADGRDYAMPFRFDAGLRLRHFRCRQLLFSPHFTLRQRFRLLLPSYAATQVAATDARRWRYAIAVFSPLRRWREAALMLLTTPPPPMLFPLSLSPADYFLSIAPFSFRFISQRYFLLRRYVFQRLSLIRFQLPPLILMIAAMRFSLMPDER
jgi:hypothetical protein